MSSINQSFLPNPNREETRRYSTLPIPPTTVRLRTPLRTKTKAEHFNSRTPPTHTRYRTHTYENRQDDRDSTRPRIRGRQGILVQVIRPCKCGTLHRRNF